MDDIKPPQLRGKDKHGNVRPADDRYLAASDKRKRDVYVAKVDAAGVEQATKPKDDPFHDVIQGAVTRALDDSRPDVTPVTSPRGDNPDQAELPTGSDAVKTGDTSNG